MTSQAGTTKQLPTMDAVIAQLDAATAARKCHTCGCLHATVEALAGTGVGGPELPQALERARSVFKTKRYDCLGCDVCFPAIAANVFSEIHPEVARGLDLCPTEVVEEQAGWPPLPGDYQAIDYHGPVAVCTLNSASLVSALASAAPPGLGIVGTMHTENLGIERLMRNVLANRHIRFLVLCGEDTRQAVGHLPGQSLLNLFMEGVDATGKIRGAPGKRPYLKNVTQEQVAAFVAQIELVACIGESSVERLAKTVSELTARNPGPVSPRTGDSGPTTITAVEPRRLSPDPAGYFVVYPDPVRARIVVEHFTNSGVHNAVLEGATPAALYAAIIERGLISRLDHAAYLGRELARCERSLALGEPYIQDRASGELAEPTDTQACGCTSGCGDGA